MRKVKIMHIGDLHLGTRQYGMARREEDFYDALNRVKKLALENDVDIVVVSGDVFDSPKPPARAVFELSEFVRALSGCGINVCGIEGNHDLTQDNYWLSVCGIRPLDGLLEGVGYSMGIAYVTGFNFCRSEELLDKLDKLADFCGDTSRYPVVVVHCGLAEMGAGFNPDLSVQQLVPVLKKIGCTYCALGHIHVPMEQKVDGIWFVQPGSLEMKSVDEPQDKSVELFELDADTGEVLGLAKFPYQTRRIVFENVNTEEDVDRILATPPDGMRDNLTVCYVSNAVQNGASRLSDFGKDNGLMFRVVPVGDPETRSQVEDFDRHDSMNLLQMAVERFFEKDSDQYRMVMDILSTGNPRMVVEKFMNEQDEDEDNNKEEK